MLQHDIFVSIAYGNESFSVLNTIQSAVNKTGHDIFRSSNILADSYDFINKLNEAIIASVAVIADISDGNPTVMSEIGYAIANKKPFLAIANGSRSVPSHLLGIPYISYENKELDELAESIFHVLSELLKDPNYYKIASVNERLTPEKKYVFISYSHMDVEFMKRILVHLKPLEKAGLIVSWDDTKIKAGDIWKMEIEKALKISSVAILIISADFLASDFIRNDELPKLLHKAEDEGTRIIPVLAKPSRFTRENSLNRFQAINDPKKTLILCNEGEQEVIYDKLSSEIEMLINYGNLS